MFDETSKLKIQGNVFSYKNSHFHQHQNVLFHFNEALTMLLPKIKDIKNGSFIKETVDLNRIIGKREVIELTGNEDIYYAQRKGRKTLTKFVSGVQAQDCSCITFVLSKINDNKFKILTAYIGYMAEKEPLDPSIKNENEFNIAKEYWDKTAMIEGSQKIYKNTITRECPWDTFQNRIILSLGDKNNIQEKINEMRQDSNHKILCNQNKKIL